MADTTQPTRRSFLLGAAAAAVTNFFMPGDAKAEILDVWTRQSNPPRPVPYSGFEPVGTILVDLTHYKLYYINARSQAIMYETAAPMDGYEPKGNKFFVRKIAEWPEWTPPPSVLKKIPQLAMRLAQQGLKSIPGGFYNPMGSNALYLTDEQGKDNGYRIHGTNDPGSIGKKKSIGCIRLHNLDLMARDTDGYIDHKYPLYRMVEKLLDSGGQVSVNIYRNGQLVPGINGPAAQNNTLKKS